jgi:predicted DNA-binding protein with PD1-like motif
MAGGKSLIEKEGPFEILSLTGTISNDGVHLHCSLSDESGQVWGGHLCKGSLIHTTAEIVLGLLEDHRLSREFDPKTGYPELVVRSNKL